ncbi:MAG TPA: NAD(P)/FAD-dependent oxidoreductase [Euzebyales bacterium]|nr:NAD(P)/FAD-dependent oxidoreductase [Euzebyales bacterium]
MSTTADVVVAGAGHNSLIAAAYLARSGREVLILEEQDVLGGGAVTEELLGPGYLIDSCSTGHTLIQGNPLLADDELGLRSEQGLTYVDPDPVAHVVFPDGESFTMWLDVERTVAGFARFCPADAEAYRRMQREWAEVRGVFRSNLFTPVGTGPSVDDTLRATPSGRVWLRRKALSAWQVISHEFTDPHVQAFVCWQASQTLVALDAPGSGVLAYSIMAGRQARSWSIPRGGSGQLTDALVRVIEAAGGTALTGRRVTELIVDAGRCVGVRTGDGEEFRAREAVLSTIHVRHLLDMAPRELWGEDFVYGVETLDVGLPAYVVYLGTTAAPAFTTTDGTGSAVSAGWAGWPEDVIDATTRIRRGHADPDFPWALVATPSLVDDRRAPAGHHTVKILHPQSHLPPKGETWDEAKPRFTAGLLDRLRAIAPNMTADVITAELARSPDDIAAANAHMIDGTFHGGDRATPFADALRPAPGWAQHRMPIPGLYQTGGTTHPGGSITGAPGRNAAQVMLRDLGTSIGEVIAAGR